MATGWTGLAPSVRRFNGSESRGPVGRPGSSGFET
jgi:hypothetical protein